MRPTPRTRLALPLLALLAALALPPVAAAAPKRTFSVGAATTVTNPPEGERLCLGGYSSCPNGGGRTMTGIRDDLRARALAVSEGDDGLIVLHTTNVGFFASYKTAEGVGAYHLRQEVAKRTGVPADHVIVQADHSHSSPDSIGIWGGVPPSYLKLMQDRAADAAVQAWEARRPAKVFLGKADGTGVRSLYETGPNVATDDVFLMLWAVDRETDRRIATWINYSPHATVLNSSNKEASGDWPEWAAQLAEQRFGGTGIAGVGTLGREDFGEDDQDNSGPGRLENAVTDAKRRLARLIDEAHKAKEEVPAEGGVGVRLTYLHEQMGQPILALNLLPEGTVNAGGYDLSLDRDIRPPFLHGTVVGTFAGAARIGDVFIGLSPGESFPQLQFYLREEGGVTGARAWFHLGATNDFLGYMVRPLDHFPQVLVEGAGYLLGCPEEEILKRSGLPYDDACPDHWTLMVSPTIGSHVSCTIQDAGLALGFSSRTRDPACATLTATDGAAAPPEHGAG
jgi:hypothetical protein